ncbi:hypothetical protein [Streptomyces sp. NPDC057877]|uniref:hypothetical protein n=1 Tax=Streptomyces sp. NPDC057877 TaxID=3346269 RepID=UPI00368395FA
MHRSSLIRGIEPGITPAVGDIVLARKSPVGPLVRALVRNVRPTRDGRRVRIGLLWLEGSRRGVKDSVHQFADGWPPMVRPTRHITQDTEGDAA